MKYFRPNSLTWWAGISSVGLGVASLMQPGTYQLNELGRLVGMLSGGSDTSPGALIFLGLGLIGIRDRLERAMSTDQEKSP